MIRIPKDSEIQIERMYQVKMVGIDVPFICRDLFANKNFKTTDGWILNEKHILMNRVVYRHQIDTDKGIYVGIFGERLNIENSSPFLNLDTDELLELLIYQTPKNIEKIINWTFEKHNNI
jgi:hypothetical protein